MTRGVRRAAAWLLVGLAGSSGAKGWAQEVSNPPQRRCGTMPRYQALLRSDPQFLMARVDLKSLTGLFTRLQQSSRVSVRTSVIRIPVVVHIVARTTAEDVSEEQIRSQITVLNADYQKKNTNVDAVPTPFKDRVGNPLLEFALAARDPEGKATIGITRTRTTLEKFYSDGRRSDGVKHSATGGADAWPRDKYLNLWVCTLTSESQGDILGYASFPGEPADVDGVVIRNSAFGTLGTAVSPFAGGRTATHEVGHWLNLFHIWGDDKGGCNGSDQVGDTPNQADSNAGCPTFPKVSCKNKPHGDLFVNYMDYTDDSCMAMFTLGQVRRMEATLQAARATLLSSDGLTPVP